jgi:hypothetical protein
LLESATTIPPGGACRLKLTTPVVGLPPLTFVGSRFRAGAVIGGRSVTSSVACSDVLPRVAVIVTKVLAETVCVVMLKLALVAPAGTVTLEGTLAAEGVSLESATLVPPKGATSLRVTVPVEGVPPWTW